jgi:hypothetical protein
MAILRFAGAMFVSLMFIVQGIYYARSPSEPISLKPSLQFIFGLGEEYGFWLISIPMLLLGFAIPYLAVFREDRGKASEGGEK